MSGIFGKCSGTVLLFGVLAIATGCGVSTLVGGNDVVPPISTPAPVAAQPLPSAAPSTTLSANAAAVAAANRSKAYQDALGRAASATALSQIAQSQDDWRLTATRWQQAIALLGTVPTTHPNYKAAQAKLPDYRRRLSAAQQQATRSVTAANPRVVRRAVTVNSSGTATASAANPAANPGASTQAPLPTSGGVFRVPIVRRAGGTPVINVTFNGGQQFAMILDTGASGTLVTPQMASALGLTPAGQTRVNTANSRNVTLSLAYVASIEAGGAIAENVLVAISGPELSIGLLGQDFFGNYDVTIRQSEVELRVR